MTMHLGPSKIMMPAQFGQAIVETSCRGLYGILVRYFRLHKYGVWTIAASHLEASNAMAPTGAMVETPCSGSEIYADNIIYIYMYIYIHMYIIQ